MAESQYIPRSLHALLDKLLDVQRSAALLNEFLGIKGRAGLAYSPTLVPVLEAFDLLLLPAHEGLRAVVNHDATNNGVGSRWTYFTVPENEYWRVWDAHFGSTGVLAADQAIAGLQAVYGPGPGGFANAVIPTSGIAVVAAARVLLERVTLPVYLTSTTVVGAAVRAPSTLGVSGVIETAASVQITRIQL